MTVRVWSAVPVPVRLKLEESNDSNKTVETDASTTMTDGWETLTFDFSNQQQYCVTGSKLPVRYSIGLYELWECRRRYNLLHR